MCNCMEDTKKQLEDRLKDDKRFEKLTDFRIVNENIALIFTEDSTAKSKPYMTFSARGEYETKSGNIRTKKEDLNITFTYCPFCGEKL